MKYAYYIRFLVNFEHKQTTMMTIDKFMAVQEPTILDQIQSGLGTIVPSGGGGELITPTPTKWLRPVNVFHSRFLSMTFST